MGSPAGGGSAITKQEFAQFVDLTLGASSFIPHPKTWASKYTAFSDAAPIMTAAALPTDGSSVLRRK